MADLKNVKWGRLQKPSPADFRRSRTAWWAATRKLRRGAVGGFQKVEDWFVAKYLTHEGETVEEAKERLAAEQAAREESARAETEKRASEQAARTAAGKKIEEP